MKLYFRYLSIHLRGMMQHKLSFLLSSVGQLLNGATVLLGVYFMMRRFPTVAGFSYQEVLLCYAVVMSAFSLAEVFARGFDTFSSMIGNGEFDRMLVRPRSAIFQVLCARLELTRGMKLLLSLFVLAYVVATGNITWDGTRIFGLILMILGGALLFSGLFLVYAGFCFFTLEGLEFMNIFTDGGREMGRYPVSIYGRRLLRFFTFIVPLACFQYYPFLYLTGRTDDIRFLLTPFACFLFLLPCYLFWRFGLRHYRSTGS
ncbi:MAG: hypothetical protein HFG27_10525 [Provencibacterium sp.]|jgi:ABC-2 type transport system permease protein|nr:hypothetical protein [Provencibacterium sp.]